jgi:hypothetical protein
MVEVFCKINGGYMNTNQLQNEINILKNDLKKRIEKFNTDSDLNIAGALIEAVYAEELMNDQPVVKGYKVNVSIEL